MHKLSLQIMMMSKCCSPKLHIVSLYQLNDLDAFFSYSFIVFIQHKLLLHKTMDLCKESHKNHQCLTQLVLCHLQFRDVWLIGFYVGGNIIAYTMQFGRLLQQPSPVVRSHVCVRRRFISVYKSGQPVVGMKKSKQILLNSYQLYVSYQLAVCQLHPCLGSPPN